MWESVLSSHFLSLYISELYRLARSVDDELTAIFKTLQMPEAGNGYLKVDRSLHQRILHVLMYSARIRAMVEVGARNRSGSARMVMKDRVVALAELFSEIDLSPVLNAAARNSVEHFDEYIDEIAINFVTGESLRPALYPVDMVLSSRTILNQFKIDGQVPAVYLVRAYIADEAVFSNCGHELHLRPLKECCAQIKKILESVDSHLAENVEGSSMLVIN